MSNRGITRVKESQNLLQSTSEEIRVLSVEWDDIAKREPFDKYRDVHSHYFDPIKRMCKDPTINIATDKFHVSQFRRDEIKTAVSEYFNKFAFTTAVVGARHLLDVLLSCKECITTVDWDDYLHILTKINENKSNFKKSQRALVPIMKWVDLLPLILQKQKSVHSVARVISVLFANGYVMRPTIITETVFGKITDGNLPTVPTIDMETGRWYIPVWKSHGVDFVLNAETLSQLRRVVVPGKYLLTNDGKNPVSSRRINEFFGGVLAPSRCRKSFITWFVMSPDRTLEDVTKLSDSIGNNVWTMWEKYLQLSKQGNLGNEIIEQELLDTRIDETD